MNAKPEPPDVSSFEPKTHVGEKFLTPPNDKKVARTTERAQTAAVNAQTAVVFAELSLEDPQTKEQRAIAAKMNKIAAEHKRQEDLRKTAEQLRERPLPHSKQPLEYGKEEFVRGTGSVQAPRVSSPKLSKREILRRKRGE